MAKKYLLYIHIDRFGEEQNKSALVNRLLAAHYGVSEALTPPSEPSPKPTLTKDKYTTIYDNDGNEHIVKLCQHGQVPQYCKYMH